MEGIPDDPSAYEPLKEADLAPLVEQMRADYSCADVLFQLPGAIPFPSFAADTPLPATSWVSVTTKSFFPNIVSVLRNYRERSYPPSLLPIIPFPSSSSLSRRRQVVPAPLIVRYPSEAIFTQTSRTQLLDSIGVPTDLQDSSRTRILIVSFGGQKFRKPGSASGMTTPARVPSPKPKPDTPLPAPTSSNESIVLPLPTSFSMPFSTGWRSASSSNHLSVANGSPHRSQTLSARDHTRNHLPSQVRPKRPRQYSLPLPSRIATATHLFIPGAPGPVVNPESPIIAQQAQASPVQAGSPLAYNQNQFQFHPDTDDNATSPMTPSSSGPIPQLLPEGWIAVICGGSPDWASEEEHLPDNLFLAPQNIFMPDLMVVGDVLLGKLGYGTVSEAIDSGTPFMYGESTRYPVYYHHEAAADRNSHVLRLRLVPPPRNNRRNGSQTPSPTRRSRRRNLSRALRKRRLGISRRRGLAKRSFFERGETCPRRSWEDAEDRGSKGPRLARSLIGSRLIACRRAMGRRWAAISVTVTSPFRRQRAAGTSTTRSRNQPTRPSLDRFRILTPTHLLL